MKRRYDSPDALYSSAPLPKAPRRTRAAHKHRSAMERRIAYRLSPAAIADAMARLAGDDAEGRVRRLILYELTSQVPGFHRLTDEQRAILVAVKRDTDLGKPGPMDWIVLMARFGQLTQKHMEDNPRPALQA